MGFNHFPSALIIGSNNFPTFNSIPLVLLNGPINSDVFVIQLPNLVAIYPTITDNDLNNTIPILIPVIT